MFFKGYQPNKRQHHQFRWLSPAGQSFIFLRHFMLILTAVLLVAGMGLSPSRAEDNSDAGEINLDHFERTSALKLSGQIPFVFQSLEGSHYYTGPMTVPLNWKDMVWPIAPDGKVITAAGIGRYDYYFTGTGVQSGMVLDLPRIYAARHVAILDQDNRTVFQYGSPLIAGKIKVNQARADHRPIILPDLHPGYRLQITLASHNTQLSGLKMAPVLGKSKAILADYLSQLLTAVVFVVAMIFLVIINIIFWRVTGQLKSAVVLGVGVIFVSVRLLNMTGGIFVLFPDMTVQADVMLGWLTYLIPTVAVIYFICTRHGDVIGKWQNIVSLVVTAIGVVALLALPIEYIESYGAFYRPFSAGLLLLIITLLARKVVGSSLDLKVTLMGMACMAITSGGAAVYYQVYQSDPPFAFTILGLLLMMASQVWLASYNFALSYRQNKKLTIDLKQLNQGLEAKIQDRTKELSEKNKMLEKTATTDVLTGLKNRRAFEDSLRLEISRSRRLKTPLQVAVIDLDHFKLINDTWGHLAGDAVLVDVAARLNKALRDIDVIGRWGGEEFIVILTNANVAQGKMALERVRQLISRTPISYVEDGEQLDIPVSASIGFATFDTMRRSPSVTEDARQLIKGADEALYKAKESGRNKIVYAT